MKIFFVKYQCEQSSKTLAIACKNRRKLEKPGSKMF